MGKGVRENPGSKGLGWGWGLWRKHGLDLPLAFALQVQPSLGETLEHERGAEEGYLSRLDYGASTLTLWRLVPGSGRQEGGRAWGRAATSPKEPRPPWYQCQGDLSYLGASLRTLRQG